jgi:methyl-accepting chemotaxis protein
VAEPIQIQVEFTGTDEAVRGASAVSGGLDTMSARTESAAAAADRLASRQTAAATAAIAFGQRLAAAANAVQGVASALGVEGQAAGLIGKITQTSSAMAQLGATFGPQGALVGGIVGAAIPAISGIMESIDALNERNAEWAERLRGIEEGQQQAEAATRQSTTAINEQSDALANASENMRRFIDSLSTGGIQRQAQDSSARITELSDQLARVNDELRGLGSVQGAAAADRMLGLQDRARELTTAIAAASDQFEEARGLLSETESAPARRGGGRRRVEEPQAAAVDEGDAMAVVRDIINEQNAALREQAELKEELIGITDKQRGVEEAAAAARAEQHEAELERQAELKDALIESADKQREVADRQRQEYQAVTGVIAGGLNDALQAIIAGNKTAEEAFTGLLASFLKYISEQSMLKAIYEYAEAIASFASYRYDQGAQHLAAGIAYTAVAVAAGAGAAALSAPSAKGAGEEKPASPESGRGDGGKGGGDIVINYNSPVVTAGTRAELGRDMAGMIRAGTQRYGTV